MLSQHSLTPPRRTDIDMFRMGVFSKRRQIAVEREKMARLEQAEGELATLGNRAALAIRRLDERRGRNHWREAIEQMIQGA